MCMYVIIRPNHLYYISIIYYVLTKFLPLGACLKTHIASISHQISRVLSYNLRKGSVNKNYRSFLSLIDLFVCLCVRKEKKTVFIGIRLNVCKRTKQQHKNSKQIGVACGKVLWGRSWNLLCRYNYVTTCVSYVEMAKVYGK